MNDLLVKKTDEKFPTTADLILPQASFSGGKHGWQQLKVLYISDIHLEHHIDMSKPIKLQIDNIVKQLFDDNLVSLIQNGSRFILLFGGDIALDTKLCQTFYHEFVKRWNYILYRRWKTKNCYAFPLSLSDACTMVDYRIETLKKKKQQLEKSVRKWMRYDSRHERKSAYEMLELISKRKDIPSYAEYQIKEIKRVEFTIKRLVDNREKDIEKMRCGMSFVRTLDLPVFSVLGNHELHAFNTVDEAVATYQCFFEQEGIKFLHNQVISYKDYEIVGGVGFAKYNMQYNADTVIGAKEMSRFDEIAETEHFLAVYHDTLENAKKGQKLVVVVTHYPTKDWLNNYFDSHCVYFTGHTHRNDSVHTETINIYANNQIGYTKKDIRFKQAYVGLCYNPFIEYRDGCYEITTLQYMHFYDYCGDSIGGTGKIDQQINSGNAKFYMIKQKGFYGFFIVNQKTGTKICAGGNIKNINMVKDITYFERRFTAVVNQYACMLLPYREIQEKVAEEVRVLGFKGIIHGCIIDVDSLHHIMINPLDGKVTYYFSPVFGIVRAFDTFEELLLSMDNCKIEQRDAALDQYKQMIMNPKQYLLTSSSSDLTMKMKELVKLDIKNSIYPISNRMKQLQRIFDSNILREWNEEFAESVIENIVSY